MIITGISLNGRGLTSFGLRTFGVNMLTPQPQHVATAFIPLDAVGVRLTPERSV